jgi:sugar phosphate isomerase/epimerase
MSLSTLPLSYCTNVHPGRTVAEVEAGLERFTVPVAARFEAPLAAGLWLARPVVDELRCTPDGPARFAERLARRGLTCHTLNAFPYGDFHGERVKDAVYRPDWTTPERRDYTLACAEILAALLPPDRDGSLSTLPLGFKPHVAGDESFAARCVDRLLETSAGLVRLRERTGRIVRLAIEPEPWCVLETTREAVAFFERLFSVAADRGDAVLRGAREHLGVCCDVCHQSVEFEDVAESLRALDRAGVRIAKVHVTCAIELADPSANADGRAALARFVEPRYLHQTFARVRSGGTVAQVDLDAALCSDPPPAWREADAWRIHFHVPVDADRLGPLGTTRPDLIRALETVAALPQTPHLEVETYTWAVLPDGSARDLVDGLASELGATRRLLETIADRGARVS